MKMFVILTIYLLLNAYVALRTALFIRRNLPDRAGRTASWCAAGIYSTLALLMVVAYALPDGGLRRMMQRVAHAFEGLFICLFFTYLLLEIVCLVLRLHKRTRGLVLCQGKKKLLLGTGVFAMAICMCVYGTIHASQLTVKHYDVEVGKPCEGMDSLRVVLIADTHIGYTVGAKRIEDMVWKVNAQNADLIVYAGDIFDNAVNTMDDPQAVKEALRGLESRLGVYACWGNHDVSERLFSGFSMRNKAEVVRTADMEEFISACGINMLADEVVLIEDAFYLVGRKDYKNAGDGTQNRAALSELMALTTPDRPVFVIDHEPRFLQENADAGVDVLLSGHTHAGQFFPLNVGINLVWENPGGILKKGGMTSVVTGGVGVYGPDLRIGTDADITVVDITFSDV